MSRYRFIRMTDDQHSLLRRTLITTCGREHQAYLLGGRVEGGLVVAEVLVPGEQDYDERTATSVVTAPACMLRVARRFQDEQYDVIADCHSHPFTKDASWFSETDNRWIVGTRDRTFLRRRPSATFVRFVTGTDEDGFTCEWWDADSATWCSIGELQIVANSGTRTIRSRSHGATGAIGSVAQSPLYERSSVLRTDAQDLRVRSARVAIVGAGGIGWELARLVSAMGVQHLTLIDGDALEVRNLNRLVGATFDDATAGLPKTDVLANMLRAHDPQRTVETITKQFPSPEAVVAISRADIVLLGTDSDRARFDVLRLAVRHLVPAIDCGTGISLTPELDGERRREGHVWVYVPGSQACFLQMGLEDGPALWSDTLRAARQDAGYVLDRPSESPGSVQALNASIAGLAVSAAESLLLGRAIGWNCLTLTQSVSPAPSLKVRALHAHQDETCPLCGVEGFEGRGGNPFVFETDDELAPGGAVDACEMAELSA